MLFALVEKPDGPKWSVTRARSAEKWYRRFLFLACKYPGKEVVPTKDIDEIWHMHLLDSRKYLEDCQAVFGTYLHHFPYFGVRGKEDKQNLEQAFLQTLALFELHFGESPADSSAGASSAICDGGRDTPGDVSHRPTLTV